MSRLHVRLEQGDEGDVSPRELIDHLKATWSDLVVTETHVYRSALAVLAFLLLVQSARLWGARALPRLRLARRLRRAIRGEHEAEALLRANGYTIEKRQPAAELEYIVEDASVLVDVRADLLVRRDGKRYVAEVKTGQHATQISNRATRRQLLEYAHAFDTDGILLIDADTSEISTIRVPDRRRKQETPSRVLPIALAIAIACVLVALRMA
jgi:hypothetical protein